MYLNSTVRIPKMKGKIFVRKKGGSSYILYQYGSQYNPAKKYAVPLRTIIGKVSPDDPALMIPNEKFEIYFPDVAEPEKLLYAYRSCCLRIGANIVIRKIMQEYGLPALLGKRFGRKDAGLFLDLVSYRIVDEYNDGRYYQDFAFCHPLLSGNMTIYSDTKVDEFLASVSRGQTIGFTEDWNRKQDHEQRVYITYQSIQSIDENRQSDNAENADNAENGRVLQAVPVGIAFDQSNQVPLFFEEAPGSVADQSAFRAMADKAGKYGYRNVGFILDQGYFSKETLRYLDEHRYPFIVMVEGYKNLVSGVVESSLHTFETDSSCFIQSCRVYGKTVTGHFYKEDTHDRYFHIYFDPAKQEAGWEPKQAAERETVQQRPDLSGYFCIITSEKMTAEEALIQYKGRDLSEKVFRADKNCTDPTGIQAGASETGSAGLFVGFAALIVRSRIFSLLKEAAIKEAVAGMEMEPGLKEAAAGMEAEPGYMTVPAAIRELEKIEMIRRDNGQYCLDHAVTRKQEMILGSFGIDESDIRRYATEIGNLLAGAKTLMENENADQQMEEGVH